MKKIMIMALMALCALSFVAANGSEEQDNVYVVASDCAWPPMEMVDENQDLVGFDMDLIKAIAAAGGFEVEIRNTAWDGIFAGLANESYDMVISSVTITEERKMTMDFSDPYINAGQVLIVPVDSDAVTLADLAGQNVGAQIGTTGAFAVEETSAILKNYDEIGLAIEDLNNGNLAGAVCDTPIAADYALNNDNYKDTLKIVGEPFTDEYYGIVVKKGNEELLAKINAGLAQVKADGLLEELENKWLR
ncbi:MAG: basic amino acid ABC transporter substrate-binding protein [Spirochaetales bacterium]|nr:basic amino acid ABC transporter substrate-binding protein [Spirochaetales bacterium]